jgi:transposase
VGEDIAEALEVIQTVRERFACRACATITQPPAPFHVTPQSGSSTSRPSLHG